MLRNRSFWCTSVLFFLLLTAHTSRAQTPCGCWEVLELYEKTCSTTRPPCQSSYPVYQCAVGCQFGQCGPQGYGSCCGKSWRTYNVYGATQCGGNQDCGVGCGELSSQAAANPNHALSQPPTEPDTRSDVSIPTVNTLTYETVLLVPDRCQHTYGILYLHLPSAEGANSARKSSAGVPVSGGF